jgi:hypothetical protein
MGWDIPSKAESHYQRHVIGHRDRLGKPALPAITTTRAFRGQNAAPP